MIVNSSPTRKGNPTRQPIANHMRARAAHWDNSIADNTNLTVPTITKQVMMAAYFMYSGPRYSMLDARNIMTEVPNTIAQKCRFAHALMFSILRRKMEAWSVVTIGRRRSVPRCARDDDRHVRRRNTNGPAAA